MSLSVYTIVFMENKVDYIAIDFETASMYKACPCSVGLVRYIGGKETDSCHTLIKPAIMYFLSEWTEKIHHITYSDVRNKPQFPEIWENIVNPFIMKTPGLPMVAHNASFDMKVLRDCFEYYKMPKPNLEYFDSCAISRKSWPELKSHALTALCGHFNIIYTAHDALEDARS